MGSNALIDSESAIDDLCLCLSIDLDRQNLSSLRQRLLKGGCLGVLEAALALRLGSALAWCCDQKQLLAGIPTRSHSGETAPALLARIWNEHIEQRQKMLTRLEELVAALNARGIVPLLLKGARSLWVGEPQWRSMRDLDLLVPGSGAAQAQTIALAEGYRRHEEDLAYPRHFHHADNLYRDDLPGWLEIHNLAGSTRSEILVPTAELVQSGVPMLRGRASAMILPSGYDLLHGMVHHHAGHREARNGKLDLKGLFEFAMGFAALSAEERAWLAVRAGKDSRLLAMIDLWVAASADRFALEPGAPFKIEADAIGRWRKLRGGRQRPSKPEAIADELTLALAPARIRRSQGGTRWSGRLAMRLHVVGWLIKNWGTGVY